MSASAPAYSSGPSELPPARRDHGANSDRIVDRFGDRDALIDQPSGRRRSTRAASDVRARTEEIARSVRRAS